MVKLLPSQVESYSIKAAARGGIAADKDLINQRDAIAVSMNKDGVSTKDNVIYQTQLGMVDKLIQQKNHDPVQYAQKYLNIATPTITVDTTAEDIATRRQNLLGTSRKLLSVAEVKNIETSLQTMDVGDQLRFWSKLGPREIQEHKQFSPLHEAVRANIRTNPDLAEALVTGQHFKKTIKSDNSILTTVREKMPEQFRSDPKRTEEYVETSKALVAYSALSGDGTADENEVKNNLIRIYGENKTFGSSFGFGGREILVLPKFERNVKWSVENLDVVFNNYKPYLSEKETDKRLLGATPIHIRDGLYYFQTGAGYVQTDSGYRLKSKGYIQNKDGGMQIFDLGESIGVSENAKLLQDDVNREAKARKER